VRNHRHRLLGNYGTLINNGAVESLGSLPTEHSASSAAHEAFFIGQFGGPMKCAWSPRDRIYGFGGGDPNVLSNSTCW
jgi:hypothetical protein